MKLHQLLMVGVLAATVLCGSAAAEYQDKMFGNGRFLRRLRDDLTGNSTPKQPTPAKSSAKNSKSNGKTPTPAKRPTRATSPTQANRSNAKAPTPAVRSNASTKRTPPIVAPNVAPKEVKRSANKPTLGFGMLLESKGEKIVVTQVNPRGNAAEAGIKKGDIIQDAGGVDLNSLEEFNEITKILGQGDQLEFKVGRRGKDKEILIQFGTAPDEGEIAKTHLPKKKNDYSFVPDGDDKPHAGLRSVMNQPAMQVRPTSAQQRSARPQAQSNSTQQRLIEEQRLQIQQMQREIQRLKQPSAVPKPVEPSTGRTILEGPSLSGPGK